jgi:hypothetical protein
VTIGVLETVTVDESGAILASLEVLDTKREMRIGSVNAKNT